MIWWIQVEYIMKRLISMILLSVVIFSFLFSGVAVAKKVHIIDENTHSSIGPGNYVQLDGERSKRQTDQYGQIDVPDNLENGRKGKYDDYKNFNPNIEGNECHVEDVNNIPEIPVIALPMAAVIGIVFFFQQRREKK